MKQFVRRSMVLVMSAAWSLPSSAFACPICNQGGRASAWFIGSVMGGAILAFVCLLLWSVGRGEYRHVERVKHRLLEIDAATGVRLQTTQAPISGKG